MTSAIEFAENYTGWILDTFKPFLGPVVLEIGTGQGNYTQRLMESQLRVVSIDLDKEAVARAQCRFSNAHVRQGDISAPDFAATINEQFDAVICVNVLEHIQDDGLAVRNTLACLRVGGTLCLLVPALPGLYGSMDRLAGHLRRYTKSGLRTLLLREGFQILMLQYFNPLGGIGWLVNRFVPHRSIDTRALNLQVKAFDKVGVPLSKLVDPFLRNVFGQSLVCVAQKR